MNPDVCGPRKPLEHCPLNPGVDCVLDDWPDRIAVLRLRDSGGKQSKAATGVTKYYSCLLKQLAKQLIILQIGASLHARLQPDHPPTGLPT